MSAIPCEVCDKPVADAAVCAGCALRVERALGEVSWLMEQLNIVLTKQTASSEHIGGRSSEVPLPYNPAASEARWVLENTVGTWARVVEEESPSAVIPTLGIGLVAAWLSTYVEWLRHHPAAGEAFGDIIAAHGQAKRLVDIKPERWYAGPCDGLDGQPCGHDLYARPNAARIACPACTAEYDATARREWLIEAAHDHLATAAEVSALCHAMLGDLVTQAMIRGYVRRGKLAPHGSGTDRRGRTVALYRIGDVIDAAMKAKFDAREQRATKRAGASA